MGVLTTNQQETVAIRHPVRGIGIPPYLAGRRPRLRTVLPVIALAVLAACAAPSDAVDPQTGFLRDLPEAVAAIAAPNQDMSAVRLRPEDGCYWYRHVGPVETTMLPLRTVNGNPICAVAQDAPASARRARRPVSQVPAATTSSGG